MFLIGAAIGCSAYLSHLRYLAGGTIGRTASLALAEALGGTLVLLGIPILTSFAFKRTRRLAVRVVGLTVMAFFSWYGVQESAKPASDFLSEVNEHRREWKKDVASQLQSKGVYEPDLGKAQAAMDAVRQKGQQLPAEGKVMSEALFSVNDEMMRLAKRYEAGRQKFLDGGIDVSSIRSLEDLKSCEAETKEFEDCNNALLKFIQEIDVHLDHALKHVELTTHQRELAIKAYKEAGKFTILLAIRNLDREIARDSLSIISLLRTEWSRWQVKDGIVVFESDSAAQNFNERIKSMTAAGEAQVDLQRQLTK